MNEQKKDKLYYERLTVQRLAKMNRTNQYKHIETEWNVTPDVNDNNFQPLVDLIMSSNKSVHIDGRAGTGKSTLIKEIQKKLTEQKIIFNTLAPTNKAARLINGMTISKYVVKHTQKIIKDMKTKVIFIDEVSMMSEKFYKFFLVLRKMRPDIKVIVSGDFSQLLPVCDRIGDCDYENSPALHELCNGQRIKLTTCRRANSELFDLCNPISINKVNISQFGTKLSNMNICFTNDKRKEINERIMNEMITNKQTEQRAKKQAMPLIIELKKSTTDSNSQTVRLMTGMPIIARKTVDNENNSFANNQMFKISKVSTEFITIIDENEGLQEIETEDFINLFYVAFAITCYKSQGSSFNFNYSIHEWGRFDWRMKYVALSRATDKKFINIVL